MAREFDYGDMDPAVQGLASLAGSMNRYEASQMEQDQAAYNASMTSEDQFQQQQANILDIRASILQDAQNRLRNEQALSPDQTSQLTHAVSSVINTIFSPGSPMERQREGMNMLEEQMREQTRLLQARQGLFSVANQIQDATQQQASQEADFILQPLMSQLSTFAGSENWAGMFAARRQVLEHPLYQHATQTKSVLSELDQGLKNWGSEISSDGRELSFHDVLRMTGSSDPAEVKEAFRILAIRSENSEGFINSIPDAALGNRGPLFREQLSTFIRDNPRISDEDLSRYKQLESQYLAQVTSQFGSDPVLAAQMVGSETTKKALDSIRKGVLSKRGSNLSDFLPPIDATSVAVDDSGIRSLTEYVKGVGTRSLDNWIMSAARGVGDLVMGGPERPDVADSSLSPFMGGGEQARMLNAQELIMNSPETASEFADVTETTAGLLLGAYVLNKGNASINQAKGVLTRSGMSAKAADDVVGIMNELRSNGKLGGTSLRDSLKELAAVSRKRVNKTITPQQALDEVQKVLRVNGAKAKDIPALAQNIVTKIDSLGTVVTPSGIIKKEAGLAARSALRAGSKALGRGRIYSMAIGRGIVPRVVAGLATGPVGLALAAGTEAVSTIFREREIGKIQADLDRVSNDVIARRSRVIAAASAPSDSAIRRLLPKNLDDLARSVETYNTIAARMGTDVRLDLPNLFGKAQYSSLYARMIQGASPSPGIGVDTTRIPSPRMVNAGITNPGLLQSQMQSSMPMSFPAGNVGGTAPASPLAQLGTPSQGIGE